MLDIDTITNAWGRWKTAQYGTTCWFTESTQYDRNKDTRDYKQYQTNVTAPKDLVYSSAVQSDGGAALLGRYDVENGSSQVLQHTVNLQQGLQDSFTWSVTEEVKVGVSVKVEAGIPFVGGAETNYNTEVSLSSMQGATTTKDSNYGASVTVPISPHTHSWGQIDLSFTDIATTWVGNVKLEGCVAIWFNNKVALNNDGDYHWLWFIPIQNVFNDCIRNNIVDTRGYVVQGGSVIAQASGAFHSSRGLDMKTVAHEQPLDAKQRDMVEQHITVIDFEREYQAIPAKLE
ncbi:MULTISPECIES: cytotoxin [unclassified Vibrio]|uniref:cytotoxin n=1 Tax=unclassified Vibrio TaxID=2614977 RepID=UPI001361E31B|nr:MULTISPECIES: cytotoxin [unclassified Vibrio]NAW59631.1 cytotoxin [Vibrio sp. V36_P2S2PM302]NAX25029.1 cytotoxin [Vibrio sp. V38_P2S17PM301]NAX28615.1 cytotoxin [Vibrio sp. V37_P2S8PM304]